jgi:hypothetical protein
MANIVREGGKVFRFPDDATPEEMDEIVKKETQTPLFSGEGIASTFKAIGPNIAKGVLGSQLAGLEELHLADAMKNITQTPGADFIEREKIIREKRAAIAAANEDISSITPQNPSYPLQIASGVVQSVAQNAPGIAAGVASRNLGMAAAIPALQGAQENVYGGTYAESQVPSDPKKKPAGIVDARANALVQSTAEAAFEVQPLGKLFEEVGKTGVSELIRRYMLRELKTEIPTTIAQQASEWATVDKEKPFSEWMKETAQAVLDTAVSVPFGAALGGIQAKAQVKLGGGTKVEEPAPAMVPPAPTLPAEIPTDITGRNTIEQSDLDDTAPFVGSTSSVSPEMLKQIQEFDKILSVEDITEDDISKGQEAIAEFVKKEQHPKKLEADAEFAELDSVRPTLDVGDLSASDKVARKGREYENENDNIRRSERPIFLAPEGLEQEGLSMSQVPLAPGVYTIGVPTPDRPEPLMRAFHEDYTRWAAEYMPDATIVLSNESLPTGAARGWHYKDSAGRHLIVPAVARKMKDPAKFNTNAQFQTFFTNYHEFSHALIDERFFEDVDSIVAATARKESEAGIVSEDTLSLMPIEKAAVLREFNDIKAKVLSGEMTAAEFVQRWMGPAKIHARTFLKDKGVKDEAAATDLVDAIIKRTLRENEILTPNQVEQLRRDYLAFDEYGAEQGARYAYSKKLEQQSATNTEALFARAFASARDALQGFFKTLKKEGEISANTKFSEWMDSLTQASVSPKPKKGSKKAAAAVKAKVAPRKKTTKAKVEKKPEKLDHNVATENVDRKKAGRGLITELVKDGTIEANSQQFKDLNALLKAGDISTFIDEIEPILGRKVNFDLEPLVETEETVSTQAFYDKFKRFLAEPGKLRRSLRWGLHAVLEMQQLAHLNPDVVEAGFFRNTNTEFVRHTGHLHSTPDRILHVLKGLGKENLSKVTNFLRAEEDSGKLWVDVKSVPDSVTGKPVFSYVPSELFYQQLKENKIDPDSQRGQELAKIILDIKNSHMLHINDLEEVLTQSLLRRFQNNPDTLMKAYKAMKGQIHAIRKRPFVPQGRFGNHMLTIEKNGVVVYREAFESVDAWKKAGERARAKAAPDEKVRTFELTDNTYVLMSLPKDFLDIAAAELHLGEEEYKHLVELLQPVKGEKALKPYDLSRLGIKGASSDYMRSYANFMWHNANMLAKMRYRPDFNSAITQLQTRMKGLEYGGNQEEYLKLKQYEKTMIRTRDFIMSPPNELHLTRSFVALGYLALNVKTALMNFAGFMTTWSHLTTELGIDRGTTLAIDSLMAAWQSVKMTDLSAGKEMTIRPEWQKALDQALREGVLQQNYAYHLASISNMNTLQRMTQDGGPIQKLVPGWGQAERFRQSAIDASMYMFRLMEAETRRATFLAVYELESRKQHDLPGEAYTNAVNQTNILQGEYSKGNRPYLMQNPFTSLATIFLSFTIRMAFHAFGGYALGQKRAAALLRKQKGEPEIKTMERLETWIKELPDPDKASLGYTTKIMMLYLAMAGYEGLPLAEDMFNLLDAWFKAHGGKPMRQHMREFVRSVDGDPVAWSHGFGHNVAGFDVSGSLGLGKIVPGMDYFGRTTSGDPEKDIGSLTIDMLGPFGSQLAWMYKAAMGKDSLSKTMERAPFGVGNVVTAYHWSKNGVRNPNNALITRDRETGLMRDLTAPEIYGKALGFNPEIVSSNKEKMFAQYDMKTYWRSKIQGLLENLDTATIQRDREAIADAREAISEHNKTLPKGLEKLRITPKTIAESMRERRRRRRLEERGLSVEKKYRPLYQDISESFQEANE